MQPNVQSKQVWDNWPFKSEGLAAVVNVARPGEALDGEQGGQCCEKSLSSHRQYWPEDFVNSGMCRDS